MLIFQLQEAGNTTTLSHYLKLFESAFLISGLELFKTSGRSKRGSSPKLILWNNALISAVMNLPFSETRINTTLWERLIENAVGGFIRATLQGTATEFFYWRDRDKEVDFVIRGPTKIYAIEVKSSQFEPPQGISAFRKLCPETIPVYIGAGGIPFEEFFTGNPAEYFSG
jgi:uncharacterized protein